VVVATVSVGIGDAVALEQDLYLFHNYASISP
jgi:hypothetical protein